MFFIIRTTIAGSMLDRKCMTGQQKAKALHALKEIHRHGVIHNDIREENILINSDGNRIFFIDFGMATVGNKRKRKFELKLLSSFLGSRVF